MRLLTGRLQPTDGVISFHSNLSVGIYDQHFEDLLPSNISPIAYLCSTYENVNILEARKYLGMFGLDGARHLINISELSGGKKFCKFVHRVLEVNFDKSISKIIFQCKPK